jgi:multicomponent Na+:H+ antiporter subunit B
MTSLVLRTATRLLVPLLLLFSIFLLLRGHNLPGGGFAGGLLAATAFALVALAYDAETARYSLQVDPHSLVGFGLILAGGSGVASLLLGRPFLSGLWLDLPLPWGGELHIGSALFFDIGVYLVVAGVVLMIVLALSEE